MLRRWRRPLTDELMDLRIKGASPRMKALREVADEHGVTHMAAICAICKAQFSKVLPSFGFDRECDRRRASDGVERHRADRLNAGRRNKRAPGCDQTGARQQCGGGSVMDQGKAPPEQHDIPPLQDRRKRVGLAGSVAKDLPGGSLLQVPDLCPPYAAVPGQLPFRARRPRLAEYRSRFG